MIADELDSNESCRVIDAVQLGEELANAKSSEEMRRILAEEVAKKVVFMSFPKEMHLASKVALVQKIYVAERAQFDVVFANIRSSLTNDQQAAQLRTQFAIRDSKDVAALQQRVHDENRQAVDAASTYLEQHPRSQGFQHECKLACRQAVAAAQGINVFD
jgi:hypothetical protein